MVYYNLDFIFLSRAISSMGNDNIVLTNVIFEIYYDKYSKSKLKQKICL